MHRILLLSVTQAMLTMAQSSPSVICAAGQCLMGYSNASIGAIISASSTNVILLPGQYTYDSNPQYLHNVLTSSSISIHPSQDIFNVSSSVPISLPLNVNLNSGIATFPSSLYSGQSTFTSLSSAQSNTNITLSSPSLLISPNTYASFTSSSSNTSIIIRDSIPDTAQLPTTLNVSTLALTSIQSTLCSTPCSSAGVCTANGTCTCQPGFAGSSCESCASGFFGPSCLACPSGCTKCDDGISGSGVCSAFNSTSAPSSCNCVNGECGSGGKCQCNPGWTNAGNGTQCAACEEGFYSTPDGNCQICQLGCTSCAPLTGTCLSCTSGFTQNANDNTSCLALPSTTSSGTTCPDGSFSNGSSCEACSPECKTCTGPSSGECVLCAQGTYMLGGVAGFGGNSGGNGSCVAVDSSGVCEGTSGAMVGNNDNHECDACPAKCTSCGIPNFNSASTINQAQCTGCLPGYVLSNGQCVESCPSGSSLSSNNTCIACPNNQLASNGSCVSTCPSNTIKSPSSQSCTPCHPDCATCSGTSFNQCSSCPPERPVLSNGRCLASCSGGEYFDSGSSKCQKCDGSCANCFASGAGSCLSCASSTQVLKSGQCVEASCTNSTSVISGLGVCLSDLVTLPSNLSNVGTVQGLDTPTILNSSSGTPWWEPFLIVLFFLLFFLAIYLWWRKKTRRTHNNPNTQSPHLRGGARGNSRLARIFFHVKDAISNSIARAKAEREAKRERDRFNGMSFVEEARMYNAKKEYQPQFTDIGERRPRSHRSRSRREREDFHDDGYTSRGRSDRSAGGSRKLNKDLPPAPSLPQYVPYQNETKETFYDVDLKTAPSAQSLRTGHQQNNGSHTHNRSQIPLKSKPSEISVSGSLARGTSRSRSVRPEQSKATIKSNKSNLHIRVPVPVPAHKTSKSHLQVPLRNAPSKASFSTYMTTASSYSQSENRSLYGGPPRNLLGFRKGTEVPPTPAQEYVMSVRSPKAFGSSKGKDVDYGNSAYDDESLWISRHQGE